MSIIKQILKDVPPPTQNWWLNFLLYFCSLKILICEDDNKIMYYKTLFNKRFILKYEELIKYEELK